MGGKSGGSQTIGYWYRLGCQTAVSHSPVDGVSQIIFGERTAWSGYNTGGEIYIDNLNLFGGEKREGGVKGRVAINMGLPQQNVDRYVAANRGETSAQRGILTMVFGDDGRAPSSNLKAINFQMSSISTTAENRIGATPTGILTVVGREMTRAQASTYIGKFYSPTYSPYGDNKDDELQDQYDIYGSWRAVALMYAYRAFVLNNLPKASTRGIRMTASEFFGVEERVPQIDTAYSEPFWWSAMNPYFKALWVRVQNIFAGWTLPNGCWYREKAAIAGTQHRMDNGSYLPINDMNPAHIIYNILTNNVWGMGYTASDIDEASFKAAANTLFNEKFGMSLAWRREEVIEEFINIILKTIDAFLRVNVLTGKFQLVLIRGNYDIDKLPVIDENIIMKLEKYERSSWGDTPNEIVLTYRDRLEESAVITVQNLAAIETQGSVISTTVEYVGVHEPELAGRIAERELINASTPIAKVTMTVNRMAFLLQAGDVFNLKWQELGITQMAMRVLSINKGTFDDGTIQIEAVEDVFGLPSSTYITEQESLWTDTYSTPVPVANAKVWEAPYYDIVHRVGEQAAQQGVSQGYTFARLFADMPNAGTPIYVLKGATRNNDSDYVDILNSASYQANFTLLDRVNRTDTTFSISAVENMPDKISENDYIVIDDEVMGIVKIDNTNGTLTVTRGNLDTIPEMHKVGTIGWVVKPNENQDETFRTLGEMVYYKPLTVTTRGTLPMAQATPFSMSLIGRSDRPYPVAGVRFNGSYFPDSIKATSNLRLTWDGRNRQMVKLNHWTYGNIQEEAGVTYNVKILDVNTNKVLYSETGLTVRDKTYSPPKRMFKFTLPTGIGELVYHYDFENTPVENKYAPVAGLVNGNAIPYAHNTVKTTPIKSLQSEIGTKYLKFEEYDNIRLPFDNRLNNLSFTVGFRLNGAMAITYAPLLYIIDTSNNNSQMKTFWINSDGVFGLSLGDNSPNETTTTTKLPNQWCDVIVRVNNTTGSINIWIDGIKVVNKSISAWNTTTTGFTKVATSGVPYLATTGANNYFSNGNIELDDVFIYNRALTDAEVNQINAVMVQQAWSEKVTVEMKTVRGNLESWQTFKHTLNMTA